MSNATLHVFNPSTDLLPHDIAHEEQGKFQSSSQHVTRRLRIVVGQVDSLREMIERGDYCIDILRRSLAIKETLSDLEDVILRGHLYKHVIAQMRSTDAPRAAEEIMAIYQFSKRK